MMLSRLVLPMMIAKDGGAIVNIGSVSSKTGKPTPLLMPPPNLVSSVLHSLSMKK
jgi:NAD(P)-dependent dehydrogenase (short-subunit alcohol dehydrogenase family)